MNATELRKITDWLIDGARSAPTPVALLTQTCEGLVAAGVPLWRVGAFVQTLHPDLFGRTFIWRREPRSSSMRPISISEETQEFRSESAGDRLRQRAGGPLSAR